MKYRRRFKAVINDSGVGRPWWEVYNTINEGQSLEYLFAEFHGKHSQTYAREHAKRLSALPTKDQP
jgi:hypothetical protein